ASARGNPRRCNGGRRWRSWKARRRRDLTPSVPLSHRPPASRERGRPTLPLEGPHLSFQVFGWWRPLSRGKGGRWERGSGGEVSARGTFEIPSLPWPTLERSPAAL